MNNLIRADNVVPNEPGYQTSSAALNFNAAPATITCLVGPSLSPPKDYLKMMAAIRLPSRGRLEILGTPVDKMDRKTWKHLRTHTGYVAGSTPLLSVQSGLINVMLPALYHRIASPAKVEQRAGEILSQLGCSADVNVLPSFMTVLERCLVSLARALILEPRLLFIEYPFQDLGTEDRKFLASVLADLKQNNHLCIITAVNNLPFVQDYADQIVYVSENKANCYAGWQEFIESSDSEVRSYLEDEDSAQIPHRHDG